MKNVKKVVSLACIAALTVSVLAGCGKAATDTKTTDTNKKVTIALWDQDDPGAQKVLDTMIADFTKANPNITVKRSHYETEDLRKNYTSASLGTTAPDIVLGPNDNLGVFVPGTLIQPLDDFFDAGFLDKFDKGALEAAKYEGKQYMLPDRNGNELLLMYNKKLVPEAPKTFEELEKIGLQLKTEKKVQYGLVFNEVEPFFTIPFLGAFDGKVFDDLTAKSPKATLNTDAVKSWLTFLKKIHDEGLIPKEADGTIADTLFKEGKAAFIINGPWGFADYQKAKVDFGIVAIPSINGKNPAPYSAVKGYTVTANLSADKKDAVKKFLTFVNSKDNQLKMVDAHQQLPTLTEAINDSKISSNPLIAAQQDPLSKATPMPIITQMRAIWDAIKPVQQQLFAGKVKPDAAAETMQKKAEEGIKALGIN